MSMRENWISQDGMPDFSDQKQSLSPMVSVIVRSYNRGYIIREALESVLQQTYTNLEIVVVDDASTDNTTEVICSLSSDKIRYIKHPVNRGVSGAANTGIQSARGDLIAFLDSDDLWKPEYLEYMVRALQFHPNAGAAFCDVEILKGDEHYASTIALMPAFRGILNAMTESRPGEYVLSSRQMYLCLVQEVPIKTIAVLLRREVMSAIGLFDEGWPSGEDWEFFLRIAHSYIFVYLNIAMAVQRTQPDSTFQRHIERDKISLIGLFTREKKKMNSDPEALRSVRSGISKQCNHLAWIYLQTGRRRRAAEVYLNAFRETGEVKMLIRLLSIAMPLRIRSTLARALRTDVPPDRAS